MRSHFPVDHLFYICMSEEIVDQKNCDPWSCPNFMQNICVFICLLKDVEGILSIPVVLVPLRVWAQILDQKTPENRKKTKPSEVIL